MPSLFLFSITPLSDLLIPVTILLGSKTFFFLNSFWWSYLRFTYVNSMYPGFMQVAVLGWHQSSIHLQSLHVTKPEQELRMLVIHASQVWVGNAGMLTELMTDTLWSLRALALTWALWDTHLLTLLACTSVSYSSLHSWHMHIPQKLRVQLFNLLLLILLLKL